MGWLRKIFFCCKKKKKVRNTRKDVPEELLSFYCQTAEEVAAFFEVDINKGLTDEQVTASRQRWGSNILKKKGGVKLWQIVFHNFFNFMSGVLFAAFVLSMATEQWAESGVVMFIIVLNALIGTIQEFKSEKTMQALQKMSSPTSRVLRNGDKTEIFSNEIVPGDIVLLREGDKLPADIRLFEVVTLECDEALLTGESLPVEKTIEGLENKDIELGDRTNVAFMASCVTKGKGRGIVVYTGQRTEIGMIADSVSGNKKDGTNLEKRMMRLGLILAAASLCAVVAVMIAFWLNDTGPIYPDGVELAVSTAVALIPEALVPVITLTLTLGVRRMFQQKAIVRKLNSLEQLGAITDVCSDKTGTLTQGKMMATDMWIPPFRRYEIDGKGFDPTSGNIKCKGEDIPRYSIDTRKVSMTVEKAARASIDPGRVRPSVDVPRPSIDRYRSNEIATAIARASKEHTRPSGEGRRSGVIDRVRASLDVRRPSKEHTRLMDESEDENENGSDHDAEIQTVGDNDRPLHMAMLISSLCNSSAVEYRLNEEDEEEKKPGKTWWKPWTWCNGCCEKKKEKKKEKEQKKKQAKDLEEGEAEGEAAEVKEGKGEWMPIGTPTEAALMVLAAKLKYERSVLDKEWADVAEYPFDSTVKLMSVVKRHKEHNVVMQFTKGAPERLLPLCTSLSIEGELVELGEEELAAVGQVSEEMGNDGLRVIGLAYRELDNDWSAEGLDRAEDVEKNLIFIGLVGIKDPPRDGVLESIRMCHRAGITVRMVTGDHPVTAMAIARQIGILDGTNSHLAFTSADFDKMTEEELDEMDELPLVIARCSPQSKVKMVEQLHHNKRTVAMTGDGVNDAPAISAADVGVAMGIAGTDVTKEASDIVLADDDFNTIVKAITEGRRIQANIRKFIVHLLVGNISQAVLIIIAIIAGMPPPLKALQILWLNMVTGTPPALALGIEPAGPELMDVTRRPLGEPLFTPGTIMDILWYGIFMGALSLANFVAMVYAFDDPEGGQATAFISLTLMLLLHAYNCRRLKHSAFSNQVWKAWPFHLALVLGTLSVIITIFVPGINTEVFGHESPGWQGWSLSIGSCIVFMMACEVYKVVRWLLRKLYLQFVGKYSGWKGEKVKSKKMRLREERAAKKREEDFAQKGKEKEKDMEDVEMDAIEGGSESKRKKKKDIESDSGSESESSGYSSSDQEAKKKKTKTKKKKETKKKKTNK